MADLLSLRDMLSAKIYCNITKVVFFLSSLLQCIQLQFFYRDLPHFHLPYFS